MSEKEKLNDFLSPIEEIVDDVIRLIEDLNEELRNCVVDVPYSQ